MILKINIPLLYLRKIFYITPKTTSSMTQKAHEFPEMVLTFLIHRIWNVHTNWETTLFDEFNIS